MVSILSLSIYNINYRGKALNRNNIMLKIPLKYFLYTFFIASILFLGSSLIFAIAIFLWLIFTGSSFTKKQLQIVFPLLLILLISILSSLSNVNDVSYYVYFRDFYYMFQPIVYVFLGFLISNRLDSKKFIRLLLISISIASLIEVILFLREPSLIYASVDASGYSFGSSNYYSALLLSVIYLISRRKKVFYYFNRVEFWFILVVNITAVTLSFSRTLIFSTIFTLFLIRFVNYRRVVITTLLFIVSFILFGNKVLNIETQGIGEDLSFSAKVTHSLSEILVKNYQNRVLINNNWRGYEAYIGLEEVLSDGPKSFFIGKGLGSTVLTPSWVFDFSSALDVLPNFHNGYVTIFLKSGIVGYFLFFLFLYKCFQNKDRVFCNELIFVSVLLLIMWTLVVHGIYSKSSMPILLIFIGYFAALPEKDINENTHNQFS